MMAVAATIIAVMRDIDAIGKDRENKMQGFRFRGIDDVYNALHDVMAKHGLFTIPRVLEERTEDRTTKNGSALIYRILKIEFDFVDETGDKITVGPFIGEGMDSGDKASNKAHSIAHKYALLQVFMIPTVDPKDPDEESHDVAAGKPAKVRGLLVTKCERKGSDEKPVFVVTFSNGDYASTFSKTLATIAKSAFDAQKPVDVTVKPNGDYFDLVSIN